MWIRLRNDTDRHINYLNLHLHLLAFLHVPTDLHKHQRIRIAIDITAADNAKPAS